MISGTLTSLLSASNVRRQVPSLQKENRRLQLRSTEQEDQHGGLIGITTSSSTGRPRPECVYTPCLAGLAPPPPGSRAPLSPSPAPPPYSTAAPAG